MGLNKRIFEDLHVLLPQMNWKERNWIVGQVCGVLQISHMEEADFHIRILQAYPLMKVGQKLGFVEWMQQIYDRVEGEMLNENE